MAEIRGKDATAASSAEPVRLSGITLASLDGFRTIFTGTTVNFRMPCTAAENRCCQILGSLSLWNECLCQAKMELRLVPKTRGHLAVSSIDGPFLRDHSVENLHKVATLLYWLLKQHRCVTELELTSGRLNVYEGLICDALHGNTSVKKLNLRDATHVGFGPHKEMCATMSGLTHLEELTCDTQSQCRDTLASALSNIVLATESLSVLHIPNLRIVGRDAIAFLAALSRNSTIADISLHIVVVTARRQDHSSPFREYLKNTCTLEKLCVSGSGRYVKCSLQDVFLGLLENKTVTAAHFKGVSLCAKSAEIAARLLEQDRMFLCLDFSLLWRDISEEEEPFNDWLVSLNKTATVEELTLPFHIWNLQQWKSFFGAMRDKGMPKKVTIGGFPEDSDHLRNLCRAVTEAGLKGKVFFANWFGNTYYRRDCQILQCRAFTDIRVASYDVTTRQPLRTFVRTLSAFSHIAATRLDIRSSEFDEALATALGDYIGSTTTLRVLELNAYDDLAPNAPKPRWTTVFQALSRNASIRILDLSPLELAEEDVELLAHVVKCSRNICQFFFRTMLECDVVAFTRSLSVNIDKNYILTNFMVVTCMDEAWFLVQDVSRRNFGLVALASSFRPGVECDK
ncbi:hypothetical protein HPB52_009669 [Rhipicephalus sanguineus]|uniref:Uncharacterized protein n=1 Tax=Rhipicephalus sanguineus TaxID=34632 RepID=A0A9D4SQP4_RHISA|nr:hypothetical protein HPB52_009669 [Rhipicephalus sanguineus]